MVIKNIDPGTRERKNKVFKRPIGLTGMNKVPIVGKCPVSKGPPSTRTDNMIRQPDLEGTIGLDCFRA